MKAKQKKALSPNLIAIIAVAALVLGGVLVYFFTTYAATRYTLTLTVSPSGSGYTTKYPNWTTYPFGQKVQITAGARSGYKFSYWSNCWGGTIKPIQSVAVTMTGNKVCTANFKKN